MKYSRLAVLLLTASTAGFAADVVLPDFLPPGTRVVVGLSVRALVDSPVLKSFGGDAQNLSTTMMKGNPLVGLNPLTDIDDVLFASTGAGEKPPSLLVIHGRFDLARLAKSGKPYNGILLVNGPAGDTNNGAMAFLDASTAIAGEPAQVKAAIDRRGQSSSISTALMKRIQALSGHSALWGVGDVPEGFHSSTATENDFESVDHFEFSASLESGLELNGLVHLRTAEAALKMTQSLKFLEMLLKSQQPSANGTKFDLSTSNGTLKLAIAIPEEELKKGIEAQKKSFSAAFQAKMQPGLVVSNSSKVEAAPPAPVKPRPNPATTVVTGQRGDTLVVTLPGGH